MFRVKEKLRSVVDFFKKSLTMPLENLLKFFFERWLRSFVKNATAIDFSHFYADGLKNIEINEHILNDALHLNGTPLRIQSATIENVTASINWKHLLDKSALVSASRCLIKLNILTFDSDARLSDGTPRDYTQTPTTTTNSNDSSIFSSEQVFDESIQESLRQSLHQQDKSTDNQSSVSSDTNNQLFENVDAYKILVKKLLLGLKLAVNGLTVHIYSEKDNATLVIHVENFKIAQTHQLSDPRTFLTEKIFSSFDFKAHGLKCFLIDHKKKSSTGDAVHISQETCIMCCAHEYEASVQMNTNVPRHLIKANLRASRLSAVLPPIEVMLSFPQMQVLSSMLDKLKCFEQAQLLNERLQQINKNSQTANATNSNVQTIPNAGYSATATTATNAMKQTPRSPSRQQYTGGNQNPQSQQQQQQQNRKRVYSFDYNEVSGTTGKLHHPRKISVNIKQKGQVEQSPFQLTIVPSSDTITSSDEQEKEDDNDDTPAFISSERDRVDLLNQNKKPFAEDLDEDEHNNRKNSTNQGMSVYQPNKQQPTQKSQQSTINFNESQLSEFLEDAAAESEEEICCEVEEDEVQQQPPSTAANQGYKQPSPASSSSSPSSSSSLQKQHATDLTHHQINLTSIEVVLFEIQENSDTCIQPPPRMWIHAHNSDDVSSSNLKNINIRNIGRNALSCKFDTVSCISYSDQGKSVQFRIHKVRASTITWEAPSASKVESTCVAAMPKICRIAHVFQLTDAQQSRGSHNSSSSSSSNNNTTTTTTNGLKRYQYSESGIDTNNVHYTIEKQFDPLEGDLATSTATTSKLSQSSVYCAPSTRMAALNILANSHKRSILVEAGSVYVTEDLNSIINKQQANSLLSYIHVLTSLIAKSPQEKSGKNPHAISSVIEESVDDEEESESFLSQIGHPAYTPPLEGPSPLLSLVAATASTTSHKFHLSVSRISLHITSPSPTSSTQQLPFYYSTSLSHFRVITTTKHFDQFAVPPPKLALPSTAVFHTRSTTHKHEICFANLTLRIPQDHKQYQHFTHTSIPPLLSCVADKNLACDPFIVIETTKHDNYHNILDSPTTLKFKILASHNNTNYAAWTTSSLRASFNPIIPSTETHADAATNSSINPALHYFPIDRCWSLSDPESHSTPSDLAFRQIYRPYDDRTRLEKDTLILLSLPTMYISITPTALSHLEQQLPMIKRIPHCSDSISATGLRTKLYINNLVCSYEQNSSKFTLDLIGVSVDASLINHSKFDLQIYDALLVHENHNKANKSTNSQKSKPASKYRQYSACDIILLKQGVYTQEQQFCLHRQPIAVDIHRILSNQSRGDDYKLNQSYYFSQRMIMLPRSHSLSSKSIPESQQQPSQQQHQPPQAISVHPQLLCMSYSPIQPTVLKLSGCIFRLTDNSIESVESISTAITDIYAIFTSIHSIDSISNQETSLLPFALTLEETCLDITLSPTKESSSPPTITPLHHHHLTPRVLISFTALNLSMRSESEVNFNVTSTQLSMSCLPTVDSTQSILLLDFEHSLLMENIWYSMLKDDLHFVSLVSCPSIQFSHRSYLSKVPIMVIHASLNSSTDLILNGLKVALCSDSMNKCSQFISILDYHLKQFNAPPKSSGAFFEAGEVQHSSSSSHPHTKPTTQCTTKQEQIAALRLQMKLKNRMQVAAFQDEDDNVIVSQKQSVQQYKSHQQDSSLPDQHSSQQLPGTSLKVTLNDCTISIMSGIDFPAQLDASTSTQHRTSTKPFAIPSNLNSSTSMQKDSENTSNTSSGRNTSLTHSNNQINTKQSIVKIIDNYIPVHAHVGTQVARSSKLNSRDASNQMVLNVNSAELVLLNNLIQSTDDPDPLFHGRSSIQREVQVNVGQFSIIDEIKSSTIRTFLSAAVRSSNLNQSFQNNSVIPMVSAVISTREFGGENDNTAKCLKVTGAIDVGDVDMNIHGSTLDFIVEFFDLKQNIADLIAKTASGNIDSSHGKEGKPMKLKKKKSNRSKRRAQQAEDQEDEWEMMSENNAGKLTIVTPLGFEKYSDYDTSSDSEQEEKEREMLFENEAEQMHHFLQTSYRRNMQTFQAFQNKYSTIAASEVKQTNVVEEQDNQDENYDDDYIDQISFSSLIDDDLNDQQEEEGDGIADNNGQQQQQEDMNSQVPQLNNDENSQQSAQEIESDIIELPDKLDGDQESATKNISSKLAIWVDSFVIRSVTLNVDYDKRGVSLTNLLDNFAGLEALNLSSISGVRICLPKITLSRQSISSFSEIGRTVAAEYISDMATNPELSFLSLAQKITIISSISSIVSSLSHSIQPQPDSTTAIQVLSHSALDITSTLFSSLHGMCNLLGIATPPPTRYLSNIIRSIQSHVEDSSNGLSSNSRAQSMQSQLQSQQQQQPQQHINYTKYRNSYNHHHHHPSS